MCRLPGKWADFGKPFWSAFGKLEHLGIVKKLYHQTTVMDSDQFGREILAYYFRNYANLPKLKSLCVNAVVIRYLQTLEMQSGSISLENLEVVGQNGTILQVLSGQICALLSLLQLKSLSFDLNTFDSCEFVPAFCVNLTEVTIQVWLYAQHFKCS